LIFTLQYKTLQNNWKIQYFVDDFRSCIYFKITYYNNHMASKMTQTKKDITFVVWSFIHLVKLM